MNQPKVIVITGGSTGLGLSIAENFAAKGWITYTLSRRANPQDSSRNIIHIKADVTQPASLEKAFQLIVKKHSRIDAVVCNAGININGMAEELSTDQARRIMDTNFYGVVGTIRVALPYFRAQRQGKILVVGSLAGTISVPAESYYCASKHAVRGFLESLLMEVAAFGISVHVVEPGFISTDLAKKPVTPAYRIKDYDLVRECLLDKWTHSISGGMSSVYVAKRVFKIINSQTKRFRFKVGTEGFWIPVIKPLMPERLYYAIIKWVFRAS